MPCRVDPDPSEPSMYVGLRQEIKTLEAMLCAILTPLEDNMGTAAFFNNVNWEEAGVSRRDTEAWWKHHRAIDAERRREEARKAQDAEDRARALSKLTGRELRLLGLVK